MPSCLELELEGLWNLGLVAERWSLRPELAQRGGMSPLVSPGLLSCLCFDMCNLCCGSSSEEQRTAGSALEVLNVGGCMLLSVFMFKHRAGLWGGKRDFFETEL